MVAIEQSDFQYLYSYAMEMGYSMVDLQVAVPRYIFTDRYDNLQERDALLQKYAEKREDLKAKKRAARAAESSATAAAEMGLKLERCRQAWLTVVDLIKGRKETLRHKETHRRFHHVTFTTPQIAAAKRIQAVIDWLIVCLILPSIDWLIGWLIAPSFNTLIDWLIDWLFAWLVGWLSGWLID